MRVTMVKKELASGEPCRKCAQAEDQLRRRGLWDRIDEVVWAVEADPASAGMRLAAEYDVKLAPFFVVEQDGARAVHTSVLKLITEVLAPKDAATPAAPAPGPAPFDVAELAREAESQEPPALVARALGLFGADCAIAFSGAEDVALLDMARKSGHGFSVLTLDTGRLHPETYRFLDRVRAHFGVEIDVRTPEQAPLQALVRKKGLFSFYEDGHEECCSIRKVGPLKQALAGYRAWMTGQRRDQSPTRTDVALVSVDRAHAGRGGALVKWNPLAGWSLADVWRYVRDNDLPYNELHDRGFVSIGCEPCTRPPRPGEHERAGRWWWEDATKRECGLHVDEALSPK